MKKSNIIISDITCMKEKFCIAGFDTYEKRMKRLMIDGGYWDENQIPKTYCQIIVENKPFDEPRDYPHRTEDVNINYNSIEIIKYFEPGKELIDCLKDTVSKDIQSIFKHHVKEKSYVLQNTKCPSLGAIVISARDIEFFIEDGKLRTSVTDFSKQKYDMKVSCKYLRDIFERTKDVDKLNGMVSRAQYAHCRIGLAGKFLIQENHCYLMLNGLFYTDMTKIFTIGFSGKKPDIFLEVLDAARISCVWDIRLWRTSTYVPYYNGDNLAAVLGNRYEYHPEFAPSGEFLADYKDKKLAWGEFEQKYRELLNACKPLQNCDIDKLNQICLLCTEKTADMCHRRLAAEYIASQIPDIEIVHL